MYNPYAPIVIMADGKLYPYNDETLAKIAVVENTRAGLPPDAVYRLERDPNSCRFRYSEIDAVQFVKPEPVEIPVTELETLVA